MSDAIIQSKVAAIVAQVLDIPASDISSSADFYNDLGCKPADKTRLMIAIERVFDIDIEDEDLRKTSTVGELVTLVCSKCKLTT